MSESDSSMLQRRINKALDIAQKYGTTDGGHHKMWVIDQMVRALTGCPTVMRQGISQSTGQMFTWEEMVENDRYMRWVRKCQEGEDGPLTYEWETGVAP